MRRSVRVATACAGLALLLCGCNTGLTQTAILVDTDSTTATNQLAPFTVNGPWQIKYTFDCTRANSEELLNTDQFTIDVFNGDDNSTAFEHPQTTIIAVKHQGTLDFVTPGNYYVHLDTPCDWTLQVIDLSGGSAASPTPQVSRPSGTVAVDVTFAALFGPYNCDLTGTSALLCEVGDGTASRSPFGALSMHRTVAEQAASKGCAPAVTAGLLTASNGDTISVLAGKGQTCSSTGVDVFSFTVTGGTGIFSGATGSGTITARHGTSDEWRGQLTFPTASTT